eukprot:GHVP01019660.1.p1 GENE.GHVP01019660.1~~GHVP01019660.1.p1  ORF type:complete len:157 (-),score=14.33 GHVP01019660.1:227-697(-)
MKFAVLGHSRWRVGRPLRKSGREITLACWFPFGRLFELFRKIKRKTLLIKVIYFWLRHLGYLDTTPAICQRSCGQKENLDSKISKNFSGFLDILNPFSQTGHTCSSADTQHTNCHVNKLELPSCFSEKRKTFLHLRARSDFNTYIVSLLVVFSCGN